jgi:hypothetical protein
MAGSSFQDFLQRVEAHVELKIVYLTVMVSAGLLVFWAGIMIYLSPKDAVFIIVSTLFTLAAIAYSVYLTDCLFLGTCKVAPWVQVALVLLQATTVLGQVIATLTLVASGRKF